MRRMSFAAAPAKVSSMNENRNRRALITRPQEDSADLAIALSRRGIAPILAPMMRIEYASADIETEIAPAQAILFTSRNGVRAFSRVSPRRDIAVFAVGDSTAALARDNGFVNVESANGDNADLARLVIDRLVPSDGMLFHAAGATIVGDLSGALDKAGFRTVRRTLYNAKPVDRLAGTATAMRNGELDYVLFFSPRTARIFVELVAAARLGDACCSLTAVCLSDAVASEVASLAWKDIGVADLATTDAVLNVIARFEGEDPPATISPPEPGTPEPATPEPEIVPPPSEGPDSEDPDLEFRDLEYQAPDDPPSKLPATQTPAPASESDPTPPVEQNPSPDEDAEDAQETTMTAMPPPPENQQSGNLPESKTPAPSSRSAAVAWTLVAVLVVLAAGYATLPSWRDRLPLQVRDRLGNDGDASAALKADTATALRTAAALRQESDALGILVRDIGIKLGAAEAKLSTMDDLAARLSTSEKALSALRTAGSQAAATGAETKAIASRLAGLEQALSNSLKAGSEADTRARQGIDQRVVADRKLAAKIGDMKNRIAGLEVSLAAARQVAVSAGKADTIALAAGQLRDALGRGIPFAAEIGTLMRLGRGNPAIVATLAKIEPMAAKGVPSEVALLASLPSAIEAAVTAIRAPENGGWMDRTKSKLRGFVRVRRIDGKGTGTDAVLARAEIAARQGDLAAVVKELSMLNGVAARAAASWLAAARSRLEADAAGASLSKIILSGLSSAG
jgi:uroporphyrinogen-III synthase